jgi:hypothetical protein
MKALLTTLMLLCLVPVAQDTEPPPPSAAILKVFDKPLPAEEQKRPRFLLDFAERKELRQFESYTTRDWRRNYDRFAASLVQKAGEQKLDSASLRKVLDLILQGPPEPGACLPVGAYQTTLENRPIWIVVLKRSNAPDQAATHFAVYAFEQRTLGRVELVQCN